MQTLSFDANGETRGDRTGGVQRALGKLVQPHPEVAFEFTPDCIAVKRLAR